MKMTIPTAKAVPKGHYPTSAAAAPLRKFPGTSDYTWGITSNHRLDAISLGEHKAGTVPRTRIAPVNDVFPGATQRGRSTAGRPLPHFVRNQMEASFGTDLSSVRIHEGTHVKDIGAIAYTQGSHIHFQPGMFRPASQAGGRLLGHELTHVLQQRAGRVRLPQGRDSLINGDPALESEADHLAAHLVNGPASGHAPGLGGPAAIAPVLTLGSTSPVQRKVIQHEDKKQKLWVSTLTGGTYKSEEDAQQAERALGDKDSRSQFLRQRRESIAGNRNQRDIGGPVVVSDDPVVPNAKKPSPEVLRKLARAREEARRSTPDPRVAISYRPGFGYDQGSFTKGPTKTGFVSAPEGFAPIGLPATKNRKSPEYLNYQTATGTQENQARATRTSQVQKRNEHLAALTRRENGSVDEVTTSDPIDEHLRSADGLFIPGGQDRDVSDDERTSRELYEQAMVRIARNRGIPTLGVCGGSRCVAKGFGVDEQLLSENEQAIHNPEGGLNAQAHGIRFPNPGTILGSAAPVNKGADGQTREDIRGGRFPSKRRDEALRVGKPSDRESTLSEVDFVNSTHKKVVSHGDQGAILSHNLPTGESELVTSALSKDAVPHPEGFETRHGAPILGVTSHPEAIHGASSVATNAASEQGVEFANNIFKHFAQSMRTYGARKAVNRELRDSVRETEPSAESHPAVTLAPHLQTQFNESKRIALQRGDPEIEFGGRQSRFKDRKHVKGRL